jgi:hypothetical protein
MAEEQILCEVSTKSQLTSLVHKEVIEVHQKGVNYTTKGATSIVAKQNIFIPFDQIAVVQVVKLFMGLQFDFIITSTSGKKLHVRDVYKDQAEKAKQIINESQQRLANAGSQPSSSNEYSSTIDVADQLLKLSKLKDAGIISDFEFEAQKKKLLNL